MPFYFALLLKLIIIKTIILYNSYRVDREEITKLLLIVLLYLILFFIVYNFTYTHIHNFPFINGSFYANIAQLLYVLKLTLGRGNFILLHVLLYICTEVR